MAAGAAARVGAAVDSGEPISVAGGVETPAVCRSAGRFVGGGDCCFEPSSAKTWIRVAGAAVGGRRRPADGDRDVLLAADAVDRRAGRDLEAGLERPEHLPRARVEPAQHAVAAAGEPEPARRRRHAASFRFGRAELPDPAARVDVDRADRPVVPPARQQRPELAVREAEEDVADELALLLRRRQLLLDHHARRLGRRVDDVVRGRVVRGRRVVQPADRRGKDRDRLSRLERRMLDAVEHLDALVDRSAGARVVREPDAFHRRHRDDAATLAADPRVVDERRLRGVVRPLVASHLLAPPLLAAGHQVDGDQRVGARRGTGAETRLVERRRRAGPEVDGVRRRVDRDRRPDRAAADEPPALAPLGLRRRDRPVRVRPGRRQVRAPRHHEAADPVLRARPRPSGPGPSRRSARSSARSRSSTTHRERRSPPAPVRAADRSPRSAPRGACRASRGTGGRRSTRRRGSRGCRSSRTARCSQACSARSHGPSCRPARRRCCRRSSRRCGR